MRGTILVIDDNVMIREALTDIFALSGATVFTAANGQEGLEILQQERRNISLVLLDMNMPVMNGEQTYHKLRLVAPYIKVIVLSSLSQVEVQSRIGLLELPTYVRKPFEVEMLLNVVQNALTNKQNLVTVNNNPEIGFLQTGEDGFEV